MKTWEMIKVLTENPEFKFESSDHIASLASSGLLNLYHKRSRSESSGPSNNLRLNPCDGFKADEWELVREPVDFMTAINSEKRIKYETWDCYYNLDEVLELLRVNSSPWITERLNGRWYIEE